MSDAMPIASSSTPVQGIVAVDKQGDRVLFLDAQTLATRTILDGFPTLPHELAISPDALRAYIPAYGDGIHGNNPHPNHVVSVVDLLTRKRLTDIDIHPFESPHTLRFAPNGKLYVCCENSHAVVVIDPALNRIVGSIDTGSRNTHRLVVLPRSGLIVTENEEDRSLSVIDPEQQRCIDTIHLPHAMAGIAVDPSESFLVAVDAEAPQLLLVDVRTRALMRLVPLTGHKKGSQVARFSENGKHLVVIGDHEPVVTLLDPQAQQQHTIVVGNKSMDAAFSPDGNTLLVANEADGTISVIDLMQMAVVTTVAAGVGCETLAYY